MDDKISDENKTEVKKELEVLKNAKSTGDIDTINNALDNVNSKIQQITQELYSNVNNQPESSDNFTGNDVEFEEVK